MFGHRFFPNHSLAQIRLFIPFLHPIKRYERVNFIKATFNSVIISNNFLDSFSLVCSRVIRVFAPLVRLIFKHIDSLLNFLLTKVNSGVF